MNLIELEILKMEHSVSYNNSYAVVLFEKGGNRTLPIIIGSVEARAIAIGLEQVETPRPLTHDLIALIFEELNVELEYIHIYKIVDGVFHTNLICKNKDTGMTHAIDSRTSDAISIAVRMNSKIFTSDEILEENGLSYQGQLFEADEEEELVERSVEPTDLEDLSLTKLNQLMKEMLDKENYEEAARIRDVIHRKQS